MIIMFLDAMASLEFMLESERVGDVFGILSNLGRIFRVCSVFYGKHCQRHNRLKYRVVLLKKLLKVREPVKNVLADFFPLVKPKFGIDITHLEIFMQG